jgi:hypothetical protein
MNQPEFIPTLFMMEGCPFCLKLQIFLLESGQLDQVRIRKFVPGTPEEAIIRGELATAVAQIGFPTAEIAPRSFMSGSDTIIDLFAARSGTDPSDLPTYRSYVDGVFQRVGILYRENIELKRLLPTQAARH